MSKKSKVPQLRFSEFTDDWEQRKLESISADYKYSIVDGPFGSDLKTADYTEEGVLVMQSNYITGGKFEIKQPYFVSIDKAEQLSRCHCKGGDILIAKIGANFGICNIIPENIEDAVLSSNCMKVDLDEKHDNDFYKHYFNLLYDTGYYYSIVGITAQPALSLKLMKNLEVPSPTLEEQLKIADFFNNLDNLITLHQRKLANLKNIKKSMLQKLFPKKGEKYPEVRFKGFNGDWEQRELGDVFKEYSEKNHLELPPLTIIQGKGTILREESDRNLQYDKANLAGYKLVRKNDLIVHLRSFEGGLERANTDGIVSPAYHMFHGDNTDTRFYYPFFRSKRFIDSLLKPHVYGIRDGKSIDIEGMKTIIIPVPSYEEQRRIGDFIESMDNLITLHQRKLDNLKNIKKVFLQQMFA